MGERIPKISSFYSTQTCSAADVATAPTRVHISFRVPGDAHKLFVRVFPGTGSGEATTRMFAYELRYAANGHRRTKVGGMHLGNNPLDERRLFSVSCAERTGLAAHRQLPC